MSHTNEAETKYRILNDSLNTIAPTHQQFHRFSQLPAELRIRIWTFALPRQRFLRIRITAHHHVAHNAKPRCPYHLDLLSASQPPSSLLHVNREASDVFSAFYRLRLPIGPEGKRAIHFCPEVDILYLKLGFLTTANIMAVFFHDILASDKNCIGIRNLAMGGVGDMSLLSRLTPSLLTPEEAVAVTTVLTNLRRFYAVISPGPEARNMFGLFSFPGEEIRRNCSVPIAAQTQEFEWLETDPREGIREDLKHVAVGVDPRQFLFKWRILEEKFGVVRSSDTHLEIRHIFAIWPESPDPAVGSRDGLVEYLRKEDARFDRWLEQLDLKDDNRRGVSELQQVADFWTFPVGTFGETPSLAPRPWQLKMVFDLSTSWPSLGLFHLS